MQLCTNYFVACKAIQKCCDIDILGAANFTEYGSPAEKEAFDFMYQFVNGKDFPSVFFVLKFWPNIFSMQEI
jgi:hypothetical protein